MNKQIVLTFLFMLVLSMGANASISVTDKPKETIVHSDTDSHVKLSNKGSSREVSEKLISKDQPLLIHPSVGEERSFRQDCRIKLIDKIQNFSSNKDHHRDFDIYSPKSVNIHPSGKKFYVNSLEGAKTVVYSLPELEKLSIINHRFDDTNTDLWTPPSGLFRFRHYSKDLNKFTGKPVESAFSHHGRYLWIPYYRRSFDINAQDPSALAVIDTSSDSIVRLMEAGVLPKMITLSPDGLLMAIAHWGDNTVGLIDVSSNDPKDWKYLANVAVGHQLFHNFSLMKSVDRDSNTGEALRGMVFTPDGRYLLVGCMGGGGIAVIDVANKRYLGKILGPKPNLRHLIISDDWVYASINASGYVQRIPLTQIIATIPKLVTSTKETLNGWQSVKVGNGARTIVASPKGDYIFAACNLDSEISIIDSTMHKIASIPTDSYPVGLDISPDGQWLISTSQGRNSLGGNCVDIYRIYGLQTSGKDVREAIDADFIKLDLDCSMPISSESEISANEIYCKLLRFFVMGFMCIFEFCI